MVGRRVGAWLAAALFTFTPAAALAHPGHTHTVMGTIKTLDAKHIVVETTDAKTNGVKPVDIALTDATKYRRGDSATERAAIKPGERVVVSYAEVKSGLTASEVRVGGK